MDFKLIDCGKTKTVRAEDLIEILDHFPVGSEDELDSDVESEPELDFGEYDGINLGITMSELSNIVDKNNIVELSLPVNPDLSNEPSTSTASATISSDPPSSSDTISNVKVSQSTKNPSKPQGKVTWKKKHLSLPPEQTEFRGNSDLPTNILELDTPFQFFQYFFTEELVKTIVAQSNLYSVTKNLNKPFIISEEDVNKFLGIAILSSVLQVSETRMFWNDTVGNKLIIDTMSINHFEKIRANLHFNDNEKQITDPSCAGYDSLYKIRPVINSLSKQFISIPMEENLSVDEQICASKARHYMKTYNPQKPHKWGYRFYVLCGVSGFAYKFEMYSGKNINVQFNDEPNLGLSSNIVVRLCRDIPKNLNFKVFFDNYYTSMALEAYLFKNGILTLGTVRRNRLPDCKLLSDGEIRKKQRGWCEEYVGSFDNVDVSNVVWLDNRPVTLLSTFLGSEPQRNINRYDRHTKSRIQVSCPNVVIQYNKHMGGVDLLDSHIGRYKINFRSRKWYFRIFYHLLDLTVINSWLLYRRVAVQKNKGSSSSIQFQLMKLSHFRIELAKTLCQIGKPVAVKRGRPSTSELQQQYYAKKKRGPTAPIPTTDVRLDHTSHFPKWNETRQRCKLPSCSLRSFITCTKCGVHLCLNKGQNCFLEFHSK